jgi:hypothetical protein
MKAIAADAGLDPVMVERAARLMPASAGESRLARVLGGPLKHRLDSYFTTELTTESAAHLLAAVRAAAEQQGEGESSTSGVSWHSVGEGSQILVTALSEGTGTRVRIMVDRSGGLVMTGMFTLLGVLAVGIAGAVGIGASGIESGLAEGVLFGAVAGVLAVGRAAWASSSRGLRTKMNALMDAVSQSLANDTDRM